MIDFVLIDCCIMISTSSGVSVLWVSWNLPERLYGGMVHIQAIGQKTCLFFVCLPTTNHPLPENRRHSTVWFATTTRILVRFRPFAYPTMMVACYLVWQLRLQP
ncbi:hypothetical protein HanXRQr2_Chr01g0004671 [Helianthus annuus]|uniref:Uncharacterized protein n=1 Tax=Helianthus annuus TaxID=4232 RepID=A0A9K3JT16_HELAN|nr:hypothetical protein HanXRQr2_Chr01g0004671 [Helianthus annuus]